MPKKLTYEYVKEYFKNNGCELLSDTYENTGTKLKYRCKCGDISYITFGNFQSGQRCMTCAGRIKVTYEEVKLEFEKRNRILLSTSFKRKDAPLQYMCCECGNIGYTNFKSLMLGNKCGKCAKNQKYTFAEVLTLFNNRGYELLETEYKNSNSKMQYRCNNGHITSITVSMLNAGQGCRECGYLKNSGKNHSNWNDNLTDEERIMNRDYKEYEQWRTSVYKRDNYTCQICGNKKSGCFNAHHLNGFTYFPDQRTDIDNGITLCKECHTEFHGLYGFRNNTKEQFVEFINNKNTLRNVV